eukprot:1738995-Ditylum_brightwellii.AAC.1
MGNIAKEATDHICAILEEGSFSNLSKPPSGKIKFIFGHQVWGYIKQDHLPKYEKALTTTVYWNIL